MLRGFAGGAVVKNLLVNTGDVDSIPESERSCGEEMATSSIQYSCLGNPMGRGAWRATVHGLAKGSDVT